MNNVGGKIGNNYNKVKKQNFKIKIIIRIWENSNIDSNTRDIKQYRHYFALHYVIKTHPSRNII